MCSHLQRTMHVDTLRLGTLHTAPAGAVCQPVPGSLGLVYVRSEREHILSYVKIHILISGKYKVLVAFPSEIFPCYKEFVTVGVEPGTLRLGEESSNVSTVP